jgi:hypothetical protein
MLTQKRHSMNAATSVWIQRNEATVPGAAHPADARHETGGPETEIGSSRPVHAASYPASRRHDLVAASSPVE